MLLGYKAILDFSKNLKLPGKGTNAACFIQLVMTSLWGISVMMSLLGKMLRKKLPPSGEATPKTTNISY